MPSFLTRSVELQRADGARIATTADEPALGAPVVLLARELCRFEPYTPPPGVRGSAAIAAARLRLGAASPYARAGSLLTRKGARLGLWWWDADAVGDGAGARLLPEPFGQPPGEGWRIVRTAGGYDAQLWRDGALAASAWRRRPFDGAAWTGFVRAQRAAEAVDAPADPPPTAALPYVGGYAYRRSVVSAGSGDALQLGGLVAATLLLGAIGLSLGQAWSLSREHERVRTALTQAEASAPRAARDRAELQQLRALAAITTRRDPVFAAAEAQRVLQPFGVRLSGFEGAPGELTVLLPAEAVAGVDLLSQALESSGRFTDVRPRLDRERRRLELAMKVRG